jgi:YegS/Rv2252/BmrU family lipid kinase
MTETAPTSGKKPLLRVAWRSRIVGVLLFFVEIIQLLLRKAIRPFYDAEARKARLARLSRRLQLIEGGPNASVARSVLEGGPTSAARRKVKIIVNPISGKGRGMKAIPELRNGFRELGFDVETIVTERAGQGKQACYALESNVAAVVAVGGDGTLNEVINGVGDQGVPIAVYSTGTANCIGKEYGIPRNAELFCRMVAEGHTLALDVAEHEGCGAGGPTPRFHSFLGVGFDAKVVEELSKERTGAISFATYTRPILTALRSYKWPPVRVEVDGEEICQRASFVIVSNIRSYAIMEAAPAASGTDGLLDVCVFEKPGFLNLFRYAVGAFTKTHTNDRDVLYVQGREVKLASEQSSVPVQIDGDNGGHLPVDIRVVPNAVKFIVPRAAVKKEVEVRAAARRRDDAGAATAAGLPCLGSPAPAVISAGRPAWSLPPTPAQAMPARRPARAAVA